MSKQAKESIESAQLTSQKALGVAIVHQKVLESQEYRVKKIEENHLPEERRRSADVSDVVYQLVNTVRAAVHMAYTASGVSKLNSAKIVELENRL